MSQTIWKHPLLVDHLQQVAMPQHARILKIAEQDGRPTMWFLWKSGDLQVIRTFRMFGTGSSIEHQPGKRLNYIDTVQIGQFVWHYFEEVPY